MLKTNSLTRYGVHLPTEENKFTSISFLNVFTSMDNNGLFDRKVYINIATKDKTSVA